MAEPLTDALKLLGFATPFAYAAATFGFFHYFDEKISDEAKTAVSAWLQPKEYDKSAVAAAMLEMFDRIYTKPLFAWRALFRSALITIGIMLIFLYENPLWSVSTDKLNAALKASLDLHGTRIS
jgi:hypothetical protein